MQTFGIVKCFDVLERAQPGCRQILEVLVVGSLAVCHDPHGLNARCEQPMLRCFSTDSKPVGSWRIPRVDELMKHFYAFLPRRRNQLVAANISSSNVAGSGTETFALVPAPLPNGWPKWARHAS